MLRTALMIAVTAFLATSLAGDAGAAEKTPIKVKAMGPDFELKGSDGKSYKLSDFKGKKAVVIAWYPKAFTGG